MFQTLKFQLCMNHAICDFQIGKTNLPDCLRASLQLTTFSSEFMILQISCITFHCLLKLPIEYPWTRSHHSTQGCRSVASHAAINAGQDIGAARFSPHEYTSLRSSASERFFQIACTRCCRSTGLEFSIAR